MDCSLLFDYDCPQCRKGLKVHLERTTSHHRGTHIVSHVHKTGTCSHCEKTWTLPLTQEDKVPKEEQWLYQNKEAYNSVKQGLDQAAKGEFADPPELPEE